MEGMTPWPKTADDQDELFFRMGSRAEGCLQLCPAVGIKTCLGTETPLSSPTPVRERLKKEGKNPSDPAVVQELYEGLFRRIAQTHPLDYYWFWTPEGWTWLPVTQQQIDATVSDLRAAISAYKTGQPILHVGHLRLGARPAATAGPLRPIPS